MGASHRCRAAHAEPARAQQNTFKSAQNHSNRETNSDIGMAACGFMHMHVGLHRHFNSSLSISAHTSSPRSVTKSAPLRITGIFPEISDLCGRMTHTFEGSSEIA